MSSSYSVIQGINPSSHRMIRSERALDIPRGVVSKASEWYMPSASCNTQILFFIREDSSLPSEECKTKLVQSCDAHWLLNPILDLQSCRMNLSLSLGHPHIIVFRLLPSRSCHNALSKRRSLENGSFLEYSKASKQDVNISVQDLFSLPPRAKIGTAKIPSAHENNEGLLSCRSVTCSSTKVLMLSVGTQLTTVVDDTLQIVAGTESDGSP